MKENVAQVDREHWLILGAPTAGRSCGSCTLCCTLVPVHLEDGYKPANERCRHQCSRGCKIYARRGNPCRLWSCRWLFDPTMREVRRPDRLGVVVDPMLDVIRTEQGEAEVVQFWVDPKRRDAHRDPALRRWLAGMNRPAIVRYGAVEGFLLVPPALMREGEWAELESTFDAGCGNFSRLSAAEQAAAMPSIAPLLA